MKKCILIDGNSIANRAFYALPLLNNDKGQYTNAVFGFTNMLLKILEEEQPTHVLVAFDAGKKTFRHREYKEYKGDRQKTPNELVEQLPLLRELLNAFSIRHYELENYEADDIIGTLSKQADQDGWETKIVTGDKDLLQLVSNRVHVALTRKGISEVEYYDVQKLADTYELKPEQIIELKGLMGDSSDNIPGVPGVGEKTALKLLRQFETVDGVYEHIDEVSGKKLKEKLVENREQAYMSKSLVTIDRESPIEVELDEIGYEGYDVDQVLSLFRDLEFHSLIERLGGETVDDNEPLEEVDVQIIEDTQSDRWDEVCHSPAALHIEVLAERYHQADIQGISICNENGLYFVRQEVAQECTQFLAWLKDEKQSKHVFGAKRAQVALKWKGMDICGIESDLFLAAYLLNPSDSSYSIQTLAKSYTNMQLESDDDFYGKGAKRKVPDDPEALSQHIARKAQALYVMKEAVEEALKKHDLYDLLHKLEQPLSHILATMEFEGVRVDREQLRAMGEALNERLEDLTQEIHELAGGVEFNINSPKQLGEILFEKLQLPVIKKTKTGYSTSAEVLEKLEPQHEIITKILDYRQLGKLQSTYIEGLLKVIDPDSEKIHTMFQQTITATGRLSSTEPNLQNIPIRLEEGRKLRKAFVPSRAEHVILAADYSQIELRVLAHLSKDQGLLEAFQQNWDIHTKTAMDVFEVEEDEVTALMRRQAKAVNFGIIYGISDYGLSQNLNITRKEAKAFIERYFESFPNVQNFMDGVIQEAKEKGYVTTIMNRRRYLPEINSRNFNMRSFAERTAMNTPIQGSAADIIKKAMINMAHELKERQMSSKLLLQVHDELIFDVPETEIEALQQLVREVMTHAVELNVPLEVDVSYGETWYDAK